MRGADQIKLSSEQPTLRTADHHCQNSDPGSSSSTNVEGQKCLFSFSGRPSSYSNLQQDIRKYIKNLETNPARAKDVHGSSRTSQYDAGAYHIQASVQSLLFDRVRHKSQVESGGLLLCGGGVDSMTLSPFGSII